MSDNSRKQAVYDKLAELGIKYELVEHPPVYTIEEMQRLDFPPQSTIAKNLFLRDAKGKRHFLLVADADANVDLRSLGEKLGTKLSFASDDRLAKYLGLEKGAVSPFGLLNDQGQGVELYLDEKLRHSALIGVHPNDNTATVFVSCKDLMKFVKDTGHDISFLSFPK